MQHFLIGAMNVGNEVMHGANYLYVVIVTLLEVQIGNKTFSVKWLANSSSRRIFKQQ